MYVLGSPTIYCVTDSEGKNLLARGYNHPAVRPTAAMGTKKLLEQFISDNDLGEKLKLMPASKLPSGVELNYDLKVFKTIEDLNQSFPFKSVYADIRKQ